jgi:hypothetical protein
MLERKKRFTRTWRESYFVLTPAGFLHEYTSSDPSAGGGTNPTWSLFLPACTLGPPGNKNNKFHIEGKKDGGGSTKTGLSLRASLHLKKSGEGSGHAWSFRARSREDMMEWWNDVRMLCARYLVASESVERSGPVEAAVRAVGYEEEGASDEDEGTDDEGSSIEESEEEGEFGVVGGEEVPPSYSHAHGHKDGLVMGANGYPVCSIPLSTITNANTTILD